MKQRIRVVGIVRNADEVLLLKHPQGRADNVPVWELPTGKIQFGEQPEEAMSRAFYEYVGIHATAVKLRDVVTFVAPAGASQLNNLYIVYEISYAEGEKLVPTERYSAYKYVKFDELSNMHLDEASLSALEIEEGKKSGFVGEFRGVANGATVYVDGSSRGNPGPSGVGYYIVGEDGQILAQGGEYIGFATSRMAEYRALVMGAKKALELGLKSVRFVSDSLMVVNQMNGIYQIKNADLRPLYREVKGLLSNFEACALVHVKREHNRAADHEASLAVDRHLKRNVIN